MPPEEWSLLKDGESPDTPEPEQLPLDTRKSLRDSYVRSDGGYWSWMKAHRVKSEFSREEIEKNIAEADDGLGRVYVWPGKEFEDSEKDLPIATGDFEDSLSEAEENDLEALERSADGTGDGAHTQQSGDGRFAGRKHDRDERYSLGMDVASQQTTEEEGEHSKEPRVNWALPKPWRLKPTKSQSQPPPIPPKPKKRKQVNTDSTESSAKKAQGSGARRKLRAKNGLELEREREEKEEKDKEEKEESKKMAAQIPAKRGRGRPRLSKAPQTCTDREEDDDG